MRTASSLSSWGTRAQTLACILGARSGPLVDAGYRVGGIGDGDRASRGGTAEQAAELSPPLYCGARSEEHTSELQSHSDLVCRLLLEKKNRQQDERQRLPE